MIDAMLQNMHVISNQCALNGPKVNHVQNRNNLDESNEEITVEVQFTEKTFIVLYKI